MKQKQNLLAKVTAAGLGKAGILLLGVLYAFSGCGVRDAAIEIPIKAEAEDLETPWKDDSRKGAETPESGSAEDLREAAEPKMISVYVCGAVVSSGVVELPEGSRASDALKAAGGFAEDAEISYVNLAAKVEDGEKLYFPSVTEGLGLPAQENAPGLVNINTAGVDALCTLSGIGEAKAGDIIAYREEHGPFGSKEDIMKVPGIKENAYKKICDKITVK